MNARFGIEDVWIRESEGEDTFFQSDIRWLSRELRTSGRPCGIRLADKIDEGLSDALAKAAKESKKAGQDREMELACA